MEEERTPLEKRNGGALVIRIRDLDVNDTDVAQLRRSFGRRSPHTDRDRHFDRQVS